MQHKGAKGLDGSFEPIGATNLSPLQLAHNLQMGEHREVVKLNQLCHQKWVVKDYADLHIATVILGHHHRRYHHDHSGHFQEPTFNYEFVVTKSQDGRTQPKVVHMQSNAQTPISVEAPANYSQTVWLVVTADKTGDGPSPDDLVGVTEKPLTLRARTSLSPIS